MKTQLFKDHFSGHAGNYAAFRPVYPASVFEWLAAAAPERNLAWDCATGNGQAALSLSRHFAQVFASDASSEQIRHAAVAPNIRYGIEPAEHSSLDDHSVDLVTVAQGYHWLDHPRFLQEAGRVLKPPGLLAIWTYTRAHITPRIDQVVQTLYDGPIGPYWPPERKHVEQGYRDLVIPWPELTPPVFTIEMGWNLHAFEAYLRTWSAVQRYRSEHGSDPVEWVHARLSRAWGEAEWQRKVRWPLALRVFRCAF